MDYDETKYAEYLNELHGEVEICGITYPTGDALYAVDPTAFAVGMADWEAEQGDDDDPNGGDGEDD